MVNLGHNSVKWVNPTLWLFLQVICFLFFNSPAGFVDPRFPFSWGAWVCGLYGRSLWYQPPWGFVAFVMAGAALD